MQQVQGLWQVRWSWVLLVAAGAAAWGAVAFLSPSLALAAVGGMVGALIAVALATRPWLFFGAYLFLLAPHVLLMALLLAQVGLTGRAVKLISTWKELALLLLLGVAGLRLMRARWRVTLPDLLVSLYGTVVGTHLIGMLLSNRPPLSVLGYGLRDVLLPFALYLVGRNLPYSEARARTLFRWLLWAGLIFSLFGIIEWSVIPTQWHVDVGIAHYYSELIGIDYGTLGLPENYWRSSGAGLGNARRAVSVYGSSQGFALSFLLLIPVSLYGVLTPGLRERRLAALVFVLNGIGLTLSLTRFTLIVCVGQMVIAAMISSRQARRWATASLGGVGLVGFVTWLASERVRQFVAATLSFEEDSSSSRLVIWRRTLEVIMDQPLGYGIGQVGNTAARFLGGAELVGIEGQVSKITVELGIPGLLSYLAALTAMAGFLLLAYTRIRLPYGRGLCFAGGLAVVGMVANGLTTEWHNSIALVYPTFWLVGSSIAFAVQQPYPPPPTKADGG